MTPLRILSFVLMGLGMLLVITGSLFRIQHWPDMFYGLVSGPVIELIGITIFVVTVIINKKKNTL
jgi:hypothetical protein